jgi:hypothetical protein
LTLAQLKDEVVARQIHPKNAPKLKTDLLHFLVDGSIHVHESDEYKQYQQLLQIVANERSSLNHASLQKKIIQQARAEDLQQKQMEKVQKAAEEREREKRNARQAETDRQRHLHKHMFPLVHRHPLAETKFLLTDGVPRDGICDLCYTLRQSRNIIDFSFRENPAKYSCEECDWDICLVCFAMQNKTEEEKKKDRLKREKAAAEQRRKWEAEAQRRQEEEQIRWDATNRFQPAIITLPKKNKDSSSQLGYTVWCSDGYDRDGWHSWAGEPDKEFDSSWKTKEEANKRAEYLFFWRNPWGVEPNQVNDENGSPSSKVNDGMHKWTVRPTDSSRWTVGVVPSAAFAHLEKATLRRHHHDHRV